MTELVPAVELADRAHMHAVGWLHGYANAHTRNANAVAIGLDPALRARMPGAPRRPRPPAPTAWIPWALSMGLDPAGELEVEHVESWVHALSDRPKNSRRQWFAALSAFYGYLRRKRIVWADPAHLIDRQRMGLAGTSPSSTSPLTVMQVRALLTAVQLDTTVHQARSHALLAVLAATGCRVDELVGLDVADYVRTAPAGPGRLRLDGKGDKQRWQKLPRADADLLDHYMREHRVAPPTGTTLTVAGQVSHRPAVQPLFTTERGTRIHPKNITPLLRRIASIPRLDDAPARERAAARELAPLIETLHPHQFRHFYAITAKQNGVELSQIQTDLGHSSLTTTETYLHATNVVETSAAQVVSDLVHAGETRRQRAPTVGVDEHDVATNPDEGASNDQ